MGGSQTFVNVRVIAQRIEPDSAVAEGKFRQDLFYRLNCFPIRLPDSSALRYFVLVGYLIDRYAQKAARRFEI